MADALRIVHTALINESGVLQTISTTDNELILASDQHVNLEKKTVADDYGTAILWETGGCGFDEYEYAMILSDQDLFVELRSGTDYSLIEVRANVPTYLSAKLGVGAAAKIDGSELLEGVDWDMVDQINVQRNAADAQGDALVQLFMS